MATYSVVLSHGCYGSMSRVRPALITNDLDEAHDEAERLTREFREGMRPHGGTSGGYRVVAGGRDEWQGIDLDREPTVQRTDD